MSTRDRGDAVPERLLRPLLRCARGEQPANVALTHLLMAAHDSAEVESVLEAVSKNPRGWDSGEIDRLKNLRDLWRDTPDALALVKEITSIVDHTDAPSLREPAHWASAFDQAAIASAQASTALYSLGRSDLFRAATDEVVLKMREWELVRPAHVVLDLGCGNGRIVEAIAPDVRLVIGLDISRRLLGAARVRCAACSNALFILSSGLDLATFADEQFDGICAVDCFPYLVQSGLAERHLQECARILRPAGRVLILNYSYSEDPHGAEFGRHAWEYGLRVIRQGNSEFKFWDGVSFLLQKN
jgi:ubiquinone/menaquinone biosynthesis C-methylase UbiE